MNSLKYSSRKLLALTAALSVTLSISCTAFAQDANGQFSFKFDPQSSFNKTQSGVTMTSFPGAFKTDDGGTSDFVIRSNLPIKRVSIRHVDGFTISVNGCTVVESQTGGLNNWVINDYAITKVCPELGFRGFSAHPDYGFDANNFQVTVGGYGSASGDLLPGLIAGSYPLLMKYRASLANVQVFKSLAPEGSFQRAHLSRLEVQLAATIRMMSNDDGTLKMPATDSRVVEASRMLMVLSAVLSDIVRGWHTDTDQNLKAFQQAAADLMSLSDQIRAAYFTGDSLAGSGSKSLAVLGTAFNRSLRILYFNVFGYMSDPAAKQAVNELLRKSQELTVRVMAKDAGDAAGVQLTEQLLAIWNTQGFQNAMEGIFQAKDAQDEIFAQTYQLVTYVQAMETIVNSSKGDDDDHVHAAVSPKIKQVVTSFKTAK